MRRLCECGVYVGLSVSVCPQLVQSLCRWFRAPSAMAPSCPNFKTFHIEDVLTDINGGVEEPSTKKLTGPPPYV